MGRARRTSRSEWDRGHERRGYFESAENDVCVGFHRYCSGTLLHRFHGVLDLIESALKKSNTRGEVRGEIGGLLEDSRC